MVRIILVALAFCHTVALCSQEMGRKEFPQLGIAFTIPDGWVGQEIENGYMLGSHSIPGIVLLTLNETSSVAALKQEAAQGLQEGPGTQLMLDGSTQAYGKQGLQGTFRGTLQFEAAKAYLISLINPHGYGVTILSATTEAAYSDAQPQVAKAIAASVQFTKVERPKLASENANWQDLLPNSRLTYMHTYSSNSGSYDGYSTGGGFSDEIQIHLCGAGFFRYKSNSSMSIDTGGAFGNSHDANKGAGNWKIIKSDEGNSVLQLNFHNGEMYEYTLQLLDGKTLLNGRRFFRTYGTTTDDGPICN